MHPPVTIWSNGTEQVRRNIEVTECTAFTRIGDGGSSVRACGLVVDGDLLVADWVVVWVGGTRHYKMREGDDGVAILIDSTAGVWKRFGVSSACASRE